jgi:membrane dipeptidase
VTPPLARAEGLCVVASAPDMSPISLTHQVEALRRGGVDAFFATVASLETTDAAIGSIARWMRAVDQPQASVVIARSVADIEAAKAAGKISTVFHFQGSEPLRGSLDLVAVFAELGLRILQPTYNYRTAAGDGCCEPDDAGLSVFGRQTVDALCRLRIAVDVSHAGTRTSLEAIERSSRPVIASHANARRLCEHPRNLTDDVIRAIASSGVIGLCAFSSFVKETATPTLNDLVDHAVYIAELVGPEHVGLGFDFADEGDEEYEFYGYDERYYPRPPWTWPTGISSIEETSNVAPALAGCGFSPADIRGIIGHNFLRALREIWGG